MSTFLKTSYINHHKYFYPFLVYLLKDFSNLIFHTFQSLNDEKAKIQFFLHF